MWQSIFEYGTLTSANSAEIGLVDSIPPVDPLISLLDVNTNEAKKEQKKKKKSMRLGSKKEEEEDKNKMDKDKFEDKFGLHESFSKFPATEAISLAKYKQMLNKKENIERTRRNINSTLHVC